MTDELIVTEVAEVQPLGAEVADFFDALERSNIRYNSVEAYMITRTDNLPIIDGGTLSRVSLTLAPGGKLYVAKSLHSGKEGLFEAYFGKCETTKGKFVTYVKDDGSSAGVNV